MNSSKDSQQAPSLPVDFESVAKKLQASRKRKDSSRSRKNQRYYSKKSKDRSGKNKSLPDNDEPPQPDHINSVDVSQNIRSGEVVMANKELELKSVDGRGGGIVNDPHQPNHVSSGEPLQHSMSEEEIIAEEERALNSVDGGEEIMVDGGGSDSFRTCCVNDPCQPNHVSSGEPLQNSMSEEEMIAEEERELNSVDGGEEIMVDGGGSDSFRTCWLSYDADRRCDNCHRRCFTDDTRSPYYFDMCLIYSHKIKGLSTPLRKIKKHQTRETAVRAYRQRGERNRYHLCRECCGFLSEIDAESDATVEEIRRLNKSRFQWSKLWPSFYWDLLVGSDTDSGAAFHQVYPAKHLWRFIPHSIRRYWLDEDMFGREGDYYGCSELLPPSYFRDRTLDLNEFVSNINSYTCRGFLQALDPSRLADPNGEDPKQFLLPDVLCPWGCGEYCHRAIPFDPSLLIQRHLSKVQLNLSPSNGHDKLFLVENSRLDYIRLDNEQVDTVLMNDNWKVLPSVVLSPAKGLCILYCRNHASSSSQRRLYTHPPKKVGNMLSSTRPDCLSHCVVRPRSVSTVRARTYNTTMTANIFTCGYAGCDSADVCLEGKFNLPSLTLFNHEVLSYWARRDIQDLASAKVDQGKIMPDLRDQWDETARRKYEGEEEMLSMATRGATFVPTFNALKLQQHCTEESRIVAVVKLRQGIGDQETVVSASLQRSWSPVIHNVNTQDPHKYGAIMKGIKPYMGRNGNATMMLWAVVGMVSSCNSLHYAIDQKQGGHHYDNYSGYILAHVNTHYMKHRDSSCPKKSPFNGRKSASFLLGMIEKLLPRHMTTETEDFGSEERFFRFDLEYMSNLFPQSEYPNVCVCSSIEEVRHDNTGMYAADQDVFISVGKTRPDGNAHFYLGGMKYEARVVTAIDVEEGDSHCLTPNHYFGTRFARHGGGYSEWWKQSRGRGHKSKQMMKQHVQGRARSNVLDDPYPQDMPDSCFYYVCVFVKDVQPVAEEYRLDMFKSIGAQCNVFCGCMNANPLIVCGRKKERRRRCMMVGCKTHEKYSCSNYGCRTRVCEECFNGMASGGDRVTLQPPADEDDDDDHSTSSGDDAAPQPIAEADDDQLNDVPDDDGYIDGDDEEVDDDCLDSGEYSDVEEEIDMDDEDDEEQIPSSHDWDADDADEVDEFDEFDGEAMAHEDDSCCDEDPCDLDVQEEDYCCDGDPCDLDVRRDLTGRDVDVGVGDCDPYEDYVTTAEVNHMDHIYVEGPNEGGHEEDVPWTNAVQTEVLMVEKDPDPDESPESWYSTPMHVLFNQLGSLCTRFNKRIKGTQFQQHFVQTVVSTMRGFSFPMLYLSGMLFPKHFWSSASNDRSAILGVMPISCYRGKQYADGFASTLQQAKTYATVSSSTTSTDHHFVSHLYDSIANRAQSGLDSRDFKRKGFKVSPTSENGIELGEADDSRLNESLNSKQAARNLAAASKYVGFDVFVTFTLNASKHPGVRHLYDWKQSMLWTDKIDNWRHLTTDQQHEVKQSFEMAYTCILNRNWLETRKLLIEFVINSARKILGRESVDAFFRDEYQESSANVCHIHGLMALCKKELSNEEFKEFICSLQRNAVCDLILTDEIEHYIEEGLLRDVDDWERFVETANEVLSHKCDDRCKRRVDDTGDDEKDLKCRKRHPVYDSIDPIQNEFIPLPFQFSEECLAILSECEFYEEPSDEFPNGRIVHDSLRPTRHIGKVTPSARENMSEVFPKYFALTRSMQNHQIVTDTNGVSRYVVKYIVKLDKGNRCIVWADQHTGAVVRCEKQFVHNSKITSSAMLEEKKFQKSRGSKHYVGRYSPFSELQHYLLGYPEVHSTMNFVEINTMKSELRPTTKLSLDRNGNLRRPNMQVQLEDGRSSDGMVCEVRREVFGRRSWRNMSRNQILTFNNGGRSITRMYDNVSLFSLRPVELMKLFPVLPQYFRWFKIDEAELNRDEVTIGLRSDITTSMWIDALGRRLKLRRNALPEVRERLESTLNSDLDNADLVVLKDHLLGLIMTGTQSSLFIAEDKDHRLPIPVMSSITPRTPSDFLLHCMLMIGEVSTELDLRCTGSMKQTLAQTKLIPNEDLDDEECLKKYSIHLVKRVIREVFPFQAITMRAMQEYIIKCKRLFDSVLLEDAIPLTELPPCLLTDLLDEKDAKLREAWRKKRSGQLDMIYAQISNPEDFPSKEEVMNATKTNPVQWDPVSAMMMGRDQTQESHNEQRVAIGFGKRAVDKYCRQLGVTSRTKGVLTHGTPGAGKTYVSLIEVLYGISQGLRVMTAALMAFRSQCIGGVHLHKLFCLEVSKSNNIIRLAELALEKLHRKSNMEMLHYLMTVDVLFLDEVGQLSSQQFVQLDIILRGVRQNNLPFGGVLILGTFDHAQQGAIEGTPFLLSSLIQTDFNLIRLQHSVRAHNDTVLQEIQRISRMNPDELVNNEGLESTFKQLVGDAFHFVDTMSDPQIGPEHQRMYAKRRNAAAAAEDYVTTSAANLATRNIRHRVVKSEDYQRTAHSNATFRTATDGNLISALDKYLREPKRLLFYEGAMFESTVNGDNYSYSQVLFMREVPSAEDIAAFSDITLWAKPPSGTANFAGMENGQIPTEEELLEWNWTKVKVRVTRERLVKTNYLEGGRKQYSLRHTCSSTINRTMGSTIVGPVAIEMTEECTPWEKGQIVVMISRTTLAEHIWIVGNKRFAINKMWQIICRKSQWSDMMETILRNLSTNADGVADPGAEPDYIPMNEVFPYRMCDVQLPTSTAGYVYLLVSVPHPTFTYVGQTEHLGRRLNQHNSGRGSNTTAPSMYMPYHVAAYVITPNLDEGQRMSMERRWQQRNQNALRQGNADIGNLVDMGRELMSEYNQLVHADEHLRFVSHIERAL